MPLWTRIPLLTLLTVIGLLVLTLQAFVVPELASEWTREFPEFASLAVPLAISAVGTGVCVQLALLITARLVNDVHRGRIFDNATLPWVDALVWCAALATAIVILALSMLAVFGTGGPPALSLLMITVIIAGATVTLLLVVLRALLRQAVALNSQPRDNLTR